MHDNTYIQTLSRSRESEPFISETFVRLNVLDYKRAEQSDQEMRSNWASIELRQVAQMRIHNEHLNNNNDRKRKTCMITAYTNGRKDLSRRREREPSISGTFVRLNVNRAIHSFSFWVATSWKRTKELQLHLNKELRLYIVASVKRL